MPTEPPMLPLEIIVLADEDGCYKVRIIFPELPTGESPTVTLSGDGAMLLGRSLIFAAYAALNGSVTTKAQA